METPIYRSLISLQTLHHLGTQFKPAIPTYIWIDDIEDSGYQLCYTDPVKDWGDNWEDEIIGYAIINSTQIPILKC